MRSSAAINPSRSADPAGADTRTKGDKGPPFSSPSSASAFKARRERTL